MGSVSPWHRAASCGVLATLALALTSFAGGCGSSSSTAAGGDAAGDSEGGVPSLADGGAGDAQDGREDTAQAPWMDGDHQYRTVEVATELENPWSFAFVPNGDILITERPGRLRIVRDGQLLPQAVEGTPGVAAVGQGGLFDVVLAPDFQQSGHVFLSYAKPLDNDMRTTAVARGRLQADKLLDVTDIFVAKANSTGGAHFGGRIVFDREGLLRITVGERGNAARAQDLSDHAGTSLRVHANGEAPSSNPFVGKPQGLPETYSYGHRNPQGIAVHPLTGEIWLNEHGPRGGDEINIVKAGANYGWPRTTFGVEYSGEPITPDTELPGIESPVLHWTPSIAPSGMAFYTGNRFPLWRGNLFSGALAGQHLRRVVLDGTKVVRQQNLLGELGARIRDVREGPDGYLYVLTDATAGALIRLEPVN